jgi:diguanylate cyclase (GGDEF)-like protein/PAS domain S-box-containing protein
LRALAQYRIDPARGLPSLTPVVDMAVKLFDCPMAAVNLVGDTHVFLAANVGIGTCDLTRDVSFCSHAINQDAIMVVEDAALDPRFHDNPLVLSGMVRFYAGVALRAPSGHALGALCVIDPLPRAGFAAQDRARLLQLAAMVSDRLELRRMEVASSTMRPGGFAATAMGSPSAILSCDDRGCLSDCNAAAADMFGWSAQEMIGASMEGLIADSDRARVHDGIRRALQGDVPITEGMVLVALRRDGSQFEAELHWSHWHEGAQAHFGVIVRDLSTTQSERDALYQLANFDPVTQLPNRNLLFRHLDEAFAGGQAISLIVADLDGFADINSTLGRGMGDRVLRHVARRIRDAVPAASLVARLSGVKFAVMLPGRDPVTLAQAAHAINDALAQPLRVEGQDIRLGGCCGLAMAPDHAAAPDELLGSGELALQQAHGSGRGGVALYIPQMRAQALARRRLDGELHRAFELGQFTLFYQPQVSLADGRITGAEALIRWLHPEHGLLLPCAFLPALEAGPLAEAVGGWVLDRACAQAAQWRRIHPDFGMSINLSVSQFRHGTLPGLVAGLLAEHNLPAHALELEITENIILNQQDRILAQLCQIRASGVYLSFDDFGTGFASLNLLRNFPVSHIKIDKGFTQLMQTSDTDRAIVRGLIHMVRDLGLEVIAEGVENAAAAQYLRQLGCHKGQGYYFGKPCSAGQFADQFLRPQGHLAQA